MKYKFLNKMISIMGFPIPIISELCIFVDWAIYAVASFALQTFFQLAEISSTIFTDVSNSEVYSTVQSILSRIMVLAGVYALFRLGIMLINLMINPDNTKKVGQTGMDFIKGAIIAVVLLASSKLIFSQLGEFQYLVLNSENRLIPKLIYGTDIENPVTYSDKKEADMFTNRVWSVFFQPRDGYATDGAKKAWENVRNGNATILSMIGRQYNEFDYYPFISGIVGMMLIYYFAIFSVELGARIIKLIILQVLSPIPIIMSVDPSQKSKLNNFFKAYLAIYLQIFVRVFTIYIAFIVLDLIQTVLSDYGSGLLTNSTSSARIMAGNFIIDIIMIFAVFQAAKELPKVVEDALGLKLGIQTSGKGSFGALVGGIIGGGAGLIGGGIAGAVGAYGGSLGTRIGAGLIGAGTGLFRGGVAGSRGGDIVKKVQGVIGAVRKSNALGGAFKATGGVIPYYKGGIQNFFGAQRKDQRTLKDYDNAIKTYNTKKDELNVDIGDLQSQVSDKQAQISTINQGDQYAKAVLDAMDTSFRTSGSGEYASVETYLARNGELQQLKAEYQELFGAGGRMQDDVSARQDALDRISAKERDLTDQYEQRRLQHYEGLLPSSTSGAPVAPTIRDENVSKALSRYNEYAQNNGLERINSYRAVPGGHGSSPTRFEELAQANAERKEAIQRQINEHEKDIKRKQEDIRHTEDARIEKERQKDLFKKSPDVMARDPEVRKAPPTGKAWGRRGPWDGRGDGRPPRP